MKVLYKALFLVGLTLLFLAGCLQTDSSATDIAQLEGASTLAALYCVTGRAACGETAPGSEAPGGDPDGPVDPGPGGAAPTFEYFVAVGLNSRLFYAEPPNFTTWTEVDLSVPFGGGIIGAVAGGDGRIVAAGDGGLIAFQNLADIGVSSYAVSAFPGANAFAMSYGGAGATKYFIVGDDAGNAYYQTSTNLAAAWIDTGVNNPGGFISNILYVGDRFIVNDSSVNKFTQHTTNLLAGAAPTAWNNSPSPGFTTRFALGYSNSVLQATDCVNAGAAEYAPATDIASASWTAATIPGASAGVCAIGADNGAFTAIQVSSGVNFHGSSSGAPGTWTAPGNLAGGGNGFAIAGGGGYMVIIDDASPSNVFVNSTPGDFSAFTAVASLSQQVYYVAYIAE